MSDVLLLNFTYEALNVTNLRRAIKLIFMGKAEIVETQNGKVVRSQSQMIPIPSIVRLRYVVKRPHLEVPLTRKNVLLRNNYTCQYCGSTERKNMTVDHIIPKSMGGKSTWENLVCACKECNARKRSRLPGEAQMKLLSRPRRPKLIPWRPFRKEVPESWLPFLFSE
jgi:5-methylcytosine-specific restriction endonuclease McrA